MLKNGEIATDFSLNAIRSQEKYFVDPTMVNQQLESQLPAIHPTTIYKHAIVLCLFIFTIVIPLSYYYVRPLGQRDGRRGFYMLTNHSSELNSSVTAPDLGSALEKVSMPNKTVIITTINAAWAEENSILDLYLQSLRMGEGTQQLLNHVLLVAVDQGAFNRCQQIHPHCYILLKEGTDFSEEEVIMSQGYLELMWARILFLKHVLALGYSFVFSDADILWFRNPFHLFDDKADFQIASDYYNGNPHDLSNEANGGFNFVRSNQRSIRFYEWWYDSRVSYPNMHDQHVLNKIKSERHLSEIGLKIIFLDTKSISGFCERRAGLEDVFTMHANCCKGMKAKVSDLSLILQDWTSFHSLNDTDVHWRAPDACLHSF